MIRKIAIYGELAFSSVVIAYLLTRLLATAF